MGNLGDALRKAGFDAPQTPPRGRGQKGGRSRRKPQLQPVDLATLRAQASPSDESRNQAWDLLSDHGTHKGLGGRRRWHVTSQDNSLPFVFVEPSLAQRLEHGEVALAGFPEKPVVIDRKTAELVLDLDPTAILFMNR